MALPKLNATPKYSLVIPSTKQKIRYRPFLVKEEKILLLALESENTSDMFSAVLDIIEDCVQDDIKRNALTTFDVEYIFLQLRSKSVGETATVGLACSECKHVNSIDVNVDDVKIDVPDVPSKIELDQYQLEIKWPSYSDIAFVDSIEGQAAQTFAAIRASLVSLYTEDERIMFNEQEDSDIDDFIESMNRSQFKELGDFIDSIPTVTKKVNFTCEKCQHENESELKGMQDFFSYA